MTDHRIGLSALGGTVVAAACVPKVPATIVVDQTRPPEHQKQVEKPERPKRAPGPDRTPPTVVRAELMGTTRVRIHFSEPVVVTEGFDPADFRISYLRVYIHQQVVYSFAYYYDPGYLNYGTRIVLESASFRDDQLDIDFSPALPPWFCRQLEYDYGRYDAPGTDTDAGLFLHYAAGRIPIRDEAGNLMTSFGSEWVNLGRQDPPQTRLQVDGQNVGQAGRNLPSVACGPPIPPGPR